MAPQRDYYQILGVSETATTDEIKKAFRRLAKQHHPDRNPNNPQSAERFKEISEAHDVLSDPEKRKKYDQLRRYGAFAGYGGAGARPGSGGAPPGAGGAGFDFDLSDLGAFGGLGELVSSIFGRRGTRGGEDADGVIEGTVPIPFKVAGRGGEGKGRRGGDLPGGARSLLPPGGAGRALYGADHPRPGDAGVPHPRPHAGRPPHRPPRSSRHAGRAAVPHSGAGHREERTARRPVCRSARADPREAHP